MLDTDFPRPPGDVGHPDSWRMPVIFGRVPGASVRAVVHSNPSALVDLFVEAGNKLAEQGAVGLITSCGFLAAVQHRLAGMLRVPIATSALLQIPLLAHTRLGPVGVITYDRSALGPSHFRNIGVPLDTPCAGLPRNGAFHAMIERGGPYDADALREEAVDAAMQLRNSVADLAAIVLECTNLPPFAADIARAAGVPVYDILTLGHWFHAGLAAGAAA